ncbi:thioesterase II family protein [Streptomyces sp. NBC_01236]|uniref:thioesterase II family protein n=1 Tax=Streptomyces sp. NBC_01236 TaxID=2903789 RepID=UPI002E160DF2|nr:thioesterase domain-containing protein [Streptomyces sp. NBC_01236]
MAGGTAEPPARPRTEPWLSRTPAPDATARLFCFPYPGLGASTYRHWPDRVGGAELCRVQPPGREARRGEEHYGTYEAFAARAADALLPWLDRPFALLGHSTGALQAFALTVRLVRRQLPLPARLFVSSQVAPHHGPWGPLLRMTDAQLVTEIGRLTRVMGGAESLATLTAGLRVLRADVTAAQRYSLQLPVPLPVSVHAIGWRDDDQVAPERMAGWAACSAQGAFRRVTLPGGHHAFLDAPPPLLAELAHELGEFTVDSDRHHIDELSQRRTVARPEVTHRSRAAGA